MPRKLGKSSQDLGSVWSTCKNRSQQFYVALGRYGQPEDIANVIIFRLSDASRFMTGEIIAVDGGASLGHRRRKEMPESWRYR